jgi:putative SOS response-associated peptidase YedK
MCGRFTQERPASEFAEIFAAEPLTDDPGGRFNVAPTDPAAVIVEKADRRAVVAYRWGLVPHWATSASRAARTINARAETVSTSPTFRDSFRRRRCIVPAGGFYEWRRDGGARLPFHVRGLGGAPLALAGLWAGWHDPETDEVRRTFTIITTTPNERIAPLHDRMPVILAPDSWDRWLDPTLADPAELHGLLVPSDPALLDVYEVTQLVNSVRNDGPALVERLVRPAP